MTRSIYCYRLAEWSSSAYLASQIAVDVLLPAAYAVTCRANPQIVFDSNHDMSPWHIPGPATAQLFYERRLVELHGNWTDQNARIGMLHATNISPMLVTLGRSVSLTAL